MEKNQKNYVYILRCADGTYYTGFTTDPDRRLKVHNSGKGAKYTRSRRPVELIYMEESEINEQYTHQILAIGVAAIVPFNALADHLMDEICSFIGANTDAEIPEETRECGSNDASTSK